MIRRNRLLTKILCVASAAVIMTSGAAMPVMAATTQQTPPDAPSGGQGGPGGGSSAVTSWTAANDITEDTTLDDASYDSAGTDENAVHVSNGANVLFNNLTVTRNSSDSTGGDNSSFYGVGSAVLTTDGTTTVNGGSITTDAAGAAGLFSYDKGITYAKDVTINTTQNTSGGVHVAGGGTMYAWDLNVTTNGESAAAIRSDRGGGTMRISGGSYTSNGVGSPAVYCTADIAVNNATLTANGSEGLCLEGLNTALLFDSDLTSDMSDDSQNDTTWSAIIYQSMSGDSEVGKGTFEMVGGSFTSKNGGLIYTTNTESDILMSNVAVTMADDAEFFLRCTGNNNQRGWGTSGDNGADCNFTADDQEMNGDIIYDSISNLDFYMTNGSSLSGAITDDESCAGNGGDGKADVYIDSSSVWTVTGDSTVSALYNAGKITDADGRTVTIVGTDGTTYVDGDSDYTITVGSYSTEADMSGALATPSWSDYEVDAPSAFTFDTTAADTSDTEDTSAAVSSETQTETAENAGTTETEAENRSSSTGKMLAAGIGALAVLGAAVAVGVNVKKRRK